MITPTRSLLPVLWIGEIDDDKATGGVRKRLLPASQIATSRKEINADAKSSSGTRRNSCDIHERFAPRRSNASLL